VRNRHPGSASASGRDRANFDPVARHEQIDPEQALEEFESGLARSAFGAATRASWRVESAQEDAHFTAAVNLLEKAGRRLLEGNDAAAAGLARRALAIEPTGDYETSPGALAASTLLFNEMADRCEAGHEEGGDAWLSELLAVFAAASGPVALEVARALDTLIENGVSRSEEKRIRAVARPGLRLEDPLDDVVDPDERVDVVLHMLRIVNELRSR
jgi:hypothetical protein